MTFHIYLPLYYRASQTIRPQLEFFLP